MNDSIQTRLKEIFCKTIEGDLCYNGEVENIDYFSLSCKAVAENCMYKLMGANLFMFKMIHKNLESVLMVYSIPINPEVGTKQIADRVMEIISNSESCFVTLDYLKSREIKEEKFIYITLIKKYDDELVSKLKKQIEIDLKPKKKSKGK